MKLHFLILIKLLFLTALADDSLSPDPKILEIFDEGTQIELTEEQIDTIRPWAVNSRSHLQDTLRSLEGLSYQSQLERLESSIKDVVLKSAPKGSELLMRYSLNRGLKLLEIFQRETKSNEKGVLDTKIRLLKNSILFALKYYKHDLQFLESSKEIQEEVQYALYGLDYASFLYMLHLSILDASAQYHLLRTALGLLHVDLWRDQNRIKFSTEIFRIKNTLNLNPDSQNLTDQDYLKGVRELRKTWKLITLSFPRYLGSAYQNININGDAFSTTCQNLDSIMTTPISHDQRIVTFQNNTCDIKSDGGGWLLVKEVQFNPNTHEDGVVKYIRELPKRIPIEKAEFRIEVQSGEKIYKQFLKNTKYFWTYNSNNVYQAQCKSQWKAEYETSNSLGLNENFHRVFITLHTEAQKNRCSKGDLKCGAGVNSCPNSLVADDGERYEMNPFTSYKDFYCGGLYIDDKTIKARGCGQYSMEYPIFWSSGANGSTNDSSGYSANINQLNSLKIWVKY